MIISFAFYSPMHLCIVHFQARMPNDSRTKETVIAYSFGQRTLWECPNAKARAAWTTCYVCCRCAMACRQHRPSLPLSSWRKAIKSIASVVPFIPSLCINMSQSPLVFSPTHQCSAHPESSSSSTRSLILLLRFPHFNIHRATYNTT